MSTNQLAVQSNPMSLMQTAIEKGADVQQLKELMDLQERWEKKEAKKSFMEALSKFQSIVPVISKKRTAKVQTKTGGHYQYKFADLATIGEAIKGALHTCGLSYRWEFEEANNRLKCHCFISHISGHTEVTTMESVKDNSGAKNDIQQTGSTQTYLQRYSLIGALGLTTAEEDNDGKGRGQQNNEDDGLWLDQWKQTIEGVSSRIELNSLYVRNRKAIDSSPEIKALMKEKEDRLKASAPVSNNPANVMP